MTTGEFNKEARMAAMKEYFTKGELIVINEALTRYQWDCTEKAENMNNETGINTEQISRLRNIAATASDLRVEFEPFPL